MMAHPDKTILMEDADIAFRNFEGREDKYNRAGDRNFCVFLDDELAEQLTVDGWNVKVLKGRDDGEEDRYYLQVAVGYKAKPPRVVLVTESGGRTPLDEDSIEVLDWVDIKTVDLIIRPYEWTVNDDSGIKAYVKTLFVVIDQDPLEQKYDDWGQEPNDEEDED